MNKVSKKYSPEIRERAVRLVFEHVDFTICRLFFTLISHHMVSVSVVGVCPFLKSDSRVRRVQGAGKLGDHETIALEFHDMAHRTLTSRLYARFRS